MPIKKIVILFIIIVLLVFYYLYLEENLGKKELIASIINVIWGITIFTVIIVLIMENRSPSKTLAWILLLVFLPIVGFIMYLIFGRNFRKKKIYAHKEYSDYEKLRKIDEINLDHPYNTTAESMKEPAIALITKLLENNNKAFLTYKNRLDVYTDGEQAINAIFEAIEGAKESVHLEFFIIKSDETGEKLKDLLLKKAAEKVQVRLLYDSVGSWNISGKYIRLLEKGGIKTAGFTPVDFPFISSKWNYRNHRKITIVDGKTGFLGGINIADRYMHKDKYYGFWRDTQLKIEGEAVHSLQAIFNNDWSFTTGENLLNDNYFREQHIDDTNPVQIITSGPDSDWESIMQGYFAMITLATTEINIVTPYLILNESMLTAIKVSALSGVRVRLIVPCKPDHHLVFWAARSYFQELMETGVEIYEYQNGFIHSKYITVDGIFSSIGSANMDIRSFLHNLEVNAFLFSKELTNRLNYVFEEDLQNSTKIKLEEYMKRNYLNRAKESFNRLFSPLL
ncbi:MAG: cardiolipin synthase [Candidatus Cloacimonetes bacterium]|nr:cardiolipin synthase [Candidatus Cloacimonadota bacterium]